MPYEDKPSVDYLKHYGKGHLDGGHSGRYPWGSGEHRYQHSVDFLSRLEELESQGLKETEIAKAMGFVDDFGRTQTTKLRVQKSLAKTEQRNILADRAQELRDKGYSLDEIAEKMGYKNDSSIRNLLNQKTRENKNKAVTTADILKKEVDEGGIIDVGVGIERQLGVSREKMDQAIYLLEREGYVKYNARYPYPTNPDQSITYTFLAKPGTEYKDVYNPDNIHYINESQYTSKDGGESFYKYQYPKSLDSSRIMIRYADDVGPDGTTGLQKDGLVELRRGVEDISLGDSNYSQVRILVDGTHYIKGMAVYGDKMPDGVDVIFNTNKTKDVPALGPKDNTVLKPIKRDSNGEPMENPFGSLIKANGQSYYEDENGNKQMRVINKKSDESDWSDWSDTLPAQFLSKQNKKIMQQQLDLSKADKMAEYEEIMNLNNPTVRKIRLKKFADECDSAAENLKAAALPGQKYHVILPDSTIPETEIYASRYKDGEKVALIRYPHGGIFEIPVLTVNNNQKIAKKIIGNSEDAVAINKKVADQLSGADFDGDTVMVIPTSSKNPISSSKPLTGLIGFEPKEEYAYREGIKTLPKSMVGKEMGSITNLITDMTIRGANEDEITRAVKHSMVVIDAEKHRLDYKRSEKENGIKELKRRYQLHYDEEGREHTGASTLISLATSDERVLKRKGSPWINQKGKPWYDETKPEGALLYKSVVEEYTDKKGKKHVRTQTSTKMRETSDARTLSSGSQVEEIYADYANYMKNLANKSRKEMVYTKPNKYEPSAKKAYADEVESINSKLRIAESNAPFERKATLLATSEVRAKTRANPELLDKDHKKDLKKINQQAITKARDVVGSKRKEISLTDKEWEAIQAGAISASLLEKVVNKMNNKELLERTTPKNYKTNLGTARINKIKSMSNSGYTLAQIADAMGVSTSTVSKVLKGKE